MLTLKLIKSITLFLLFFGSVGVLTDNVEDACKKDLHDTSSCETSVKECTLNTENFVKEVCLSYFVLPTPCTRL